MGWGCGTEGVRVQTSKYTNHSVNGNAFVKLIYLLVFLPHMCTMASEMHIKRYTALATPQCPRMGCAKRCLLHWAIDKSTTRLVPLDPPPHDFPTLFCITVLICPGGMKVVTSHRIYASSSVKHPVKVHGLTIYNSLLELSSDATT